MADISVKYLGFTLKSPIVVSSSGLTSSLDRIATLDKAGAGAIVLKSLFEEQIRYESSAMHRGGSYPEAADYINYYVKSNSLEDYLNLIEKAKEITSVPIIASLNCVSAKEWISFAREIEKAGADALELNVFFLPTNTKSSCAEVESLYFALLEKVQKYVKIPILIKIGQQFTTLSNFVSRLYYRGVKSVVIFNRFYFPDIDVDKVKITASEIYSSPADIRQTLRWTGILSKALPKIQISSSTGVHDGNAVIKLLLAGATTIQVCSALYINGLNYLSQILAEVSDWMDKHKYKKISDFRGKLSYKNIPDPSMYERTQFMKYYSSRL